MAKNKKNSSLGLGLAALLGLFALSSGNKTKKTTTTKPAPQDEDNNIFTGENQPPTEFSENNGVTSVVASDIVPFIVPSSFVITPVKNKLHTEGQYTESAKINFLLCIHVPTTSIGTLQIEEVDIKDIQLVRYIDDLHQEWINPFANDLFGFVKTANEILYVNQLKKLSEAFKGKEVSTGYNLFEVEFIISPYYYSDDKIKEEVSKWLYYQYEAISIGLNIKYEETRLAHWRLLSAWNITKDELINTGDSFGTNTRFGVVRDYTSKPRDQRGLFSEWWSEYLSAGYNTNISKIEPEIPLAI